MTKAIAVAVSRLYPCELSPIGNKIKPGLIAGPFFHAIHPIHLVPRFIFHPIQNILTKIFRTGGAIDIKWGRFYNPPVSFI
jgi:hypothetical protein